MPEKSSRPNPVVSDTTTREVRVGATSFYLPEHSDPERDRHVFGYRIVILNGGASRVQLLARHWIIIDGEGNREEVRGAGVVGQTPFIEPGKGFKYESFCPLETEWGTMEGTYRMQSEDGEVFDATIGRFVLAMGAPAFSGS